VKRCRPELSEIHRVTADSAGHLEHLRRLVDQRLSEYLSGVEDCPPRLQEALRYSLLAPGKRLRPLLVLLAAEACGSPPDVALPVACALEMVHTYSLVHDDLPAMDDDDLRRGRPTCHKQFDEATAILAGDALLTLAFQVIAEDVQPPALAATCGSELARAAGACGMVGGQMADLEWEKRTDRRLEDLDAIHQKKTGALFRVALRLGGLLGCQSRHDPRLADLDRYADRLGLAFQISDDLLDVEGSAEQTGKRVGKDATRGKLTYPGLLGIAESRRRLAQICHEARQALASFGPEGRHLIGLVHMIEHRER
jgi:geranylgeranyl diphosphate synthase type II